MKKDIKDWESWINNKTNFIRNINEAVLILDDEFEPIEDNIDIDSIEELSSEYTMNNVEFQLQDKLNQLVQAVKQLNREIKELKEK